MNPDEKFAKDVHSEDDFYDETIVITFYFHNNRLSKFHINKITSF